MSEIGDGGTVAASGYKANGGRWLGLATDHWRLFDALEAGWFPPGTAGGRVLGIGWFADDEAAVGDRIRVRVRIEPTRLPGIVVPALRNGQWEDVPLHEMDGAGYTVLQWSGALPAFALSHIAVGSEEERSRLLGLAEGTSTLSVPQLTVEPEVVMERDLLATGALPPAPPMVALPNHLDAHQGAMSLALHYVPRMEPWLRLLAASLDPALPGLARLAEKLDARWWRVPPWFSSSVEEAPQALDDCLWRAATEVFRRPERRPPLALASRIHDVAGATVPASAEREALGAWLAETEGILSGERGMSFADWRANPVGLAIQLVLTRSEPDWFASWLTDHPELPPGVAWSAATLCGLLAGYRGLPLKFRGPDARRDALAIHALRSATPGGEADLWPSPREPAPRVDRAGDDLRLLWDGKPVWEKQPSPRGAWLDADLGVDGTEERAVALARELRWQCLNHTILLRPGVRKLPGSGQVKISGRKPKKKIEVTGTVSLVMENPPQVQESLDSARFRHCLLTEPGRVAGCPPAARRVPTSNSQLADHQPRPSAKLVESPVVRGLMYLPEFLDPAAEQCLLDFIDGQAWDERMQRRVQHYGWRYDYKAQQVDASAWLGPVPEPLAHLAKRLVHEGWVSREPDQVIVNEYLGHQGISKHVDARSFDEQVAMVSLFESWPMVFQRKTDKQKETVVLERGSLVVLSGEARWDWTHEIPKLKHLPRSRKLRGRRVSLTFRRVVRPSEAGTARPVRRESPKVKRAEARSVGADRGSQPAPARRARPARSVLPFGGGKAKSGAARQKTRRSPESGPARR